MAEKGSSGRSILNRTAPGEAGRHSHAHSPRVIHNNIRRRRPGLKVTGKHSERRRIDVGFIYMEAWRKRSFVEKWLTLSFGFKKLVGFMRIYMDKVIMNEILMMFWNIITLIKHTHLLTWKDDVFRFNDAINLCFCFCFCFRWSVIVLCNHLNRHT